MSAHNRSGPPAGPSASTYPRGGGGYRGRGAPRGGYRGDFSYPTAPRREPSSSYSTSAAATSSRDPASYAHDHSRSATTGIPPPPRHRDSSYNQPPNLPAFRTSNSTSTTYPRTKRFDSHTALADLPTLKEGGERLAPLHDTTKADKLEEEAARLRKMIDDREQARRAGLREWGHSEREVGTAGLRSELAEEGLRRLNGEGSGTAAF